MTEIVASFEIKRWDAEVYQEPAEGQTLSQVLVEKEFSGAVTGTSVARLLAARSEGGQGYVASERFEGSVDGRSGAWSISTAASWAAGWGRRSGTSFLVAARANSRGRRGRWSSGTTRTALR